jgi:glycosyltransferase involved in cell wall biosynthesis
LGFQSILDDQMIGEEKKIKPRFSVITPSLNQGEYIEKTIMSVLDQSYPSFEHIVIDGGSVDNTISILSSHPHLNWISEPDSGQSNALNKGFKRASGEIIAWINSDDWYAPGAFECVDQFFRDNAQAKIVMGNCLRTNQVGEPFDEVINYERGLPELRRYWVNHAIPTQPAVFFKRQMLLAHGFLDESLHYAMDYELWLRFANAQRFYHVNKTLAHYRFHPEAKGGTNDWSKFIEEWEMVYGQQIGILAKMADWLPKNAARLKNRLRKLRD